ncbi:MAG: amino acid adenylation domain-containing protein [Agathobacter sp.]|nr:amino acid adenylation domain-containing protein [Agathobacter sp.]
MITVQLGKTIKKYPNSVACADFEHKITYQELGNSAKRIACGIIRKLSVDHRPIVVLMEKSVHCFVSMFSILYSGNFYVCVDPHMGNERLNIIFENLEPAAILFDDNDFGIEYPCEKLEYGTLLLENSVDEDLIEKTGNKVIETDLAYVLYTSGSTGIPKGVAITHRSVEQYAKWVVNTFHIGNDTVFGSQTPFYFSMSVLDIYATIFSGALLQIIPKKFFSFPVKLMQFMEEKKINTIYWVPSAYGFVTNMDALNYVRPSELNTLMFAGEVMPARFLNYWRRFYPDAVFANLFGPTEITDIALYYIVDREFKADEAIPIGRVCMGMDAFALDEDNNMIREGEEGELYFRGEFVGCGYYNAWDKTRESFVQNPLNDKYPEIVYRTGDIVRLNSRGEYMYAGRRDHQIKHSGYRIELGEIETVIGAVEGVQHAVCVYDDEKDEIIGIYVGTVDEAEVVKRMYNKLPSYMQPTLLKKMISLPLNANGKVDRLLLKNQIFKGEL